MSGAKVEDALRRTVTVERLKTLCNRDCPDTCGIVASVEGGRIVKIGGDPDHPVTRGFLCYRTNQFLRRQYSPERLTSPLLRKSGELTAVSWDEALDYVAEALVRIRRESSAASIFHYRSGGSLGMLKVLSDYFFELFGPVTIKRGDICSGAGEAAQELDFGVSDSGDLEGLLEARHIISWGKNLHVSSPHLIPIIKAAIARGTEVVLVDPVAHAGQRLAHRYHQVAPGGDFALALAVARVLFARGHVAPAARSYCDHLDEFQALAESRTLDDWCREADVSRDVAEDLAWRLGPGKPCAILVGWGMGRRSNGGAIVRALDALSALSGNIGLAGGGVSFYFQRRRAFETAFIKGAAAAPRTIAEPLFGPEIATLNDPPIRALWVTAGNPVAMLPESETTARAIAALDLSVVVDAFLTDTARVSNVVLPTTTLLEDDDVLGSYGQPMLGVSRPVVPAPEGVKSDLEIIQALAGRLGLASELAGSHRDWKRRLVEPRLAPFGIELEHLESEALRNPLAPKVVFADLRFPTASGRVNLLTAAPAAPAAPDPAFPLTLLALSTPKSQSSQWALDAPAVLEATVHPDVAGGMPDGARCRLESRLGGLEVVVRHDSTQRRDVVLVPKGGHRHMHACANSLLEARLTDLGEGGALYEQAVRLVPLDAQAPAPG
jgi:anaerobic selenocysteine-containing dehydrogenase